MLILAPSGITLWRSRTSGELSSKQTVVVLNICSRGVVDVMREKESSGDPDMMDLKYFLMNEVVIAFDWFVRSFILSKADV